MSFLTHAQLRHGVWSALHADSAHSDRGIFQGPRHGRIAWRKPVPQLTVPLNPVLDLDGNLYACVPDQLLGWNANGDPLLLPDRPDRPLEFHDRIGAEQHLGPGRTLILTTGSAVSCLSLQGSLRWQVRNLAATRPVISPDGNELYLLITPGDRDGLELIALGTGTGIEHWRQSFPRDGVSAPAIAADGTLYVVAEDAGRTQQTLRAIDGKTGEEHWRQKIAPTLQCRAPRLFGDELIYVSGTSMLQAFQPTGAAIWSLKIAADQPPAIAGAGQLLLLQGQPADSQWQLCAYWPDGQSAGQAVLPSQVNAFGLPPVVDAIGCVYMLGRVAGGGWRLQQYLPDLKPGFHLTFPDRHAYGPALALGRERLYLAGYAVDEPAPQRCAWICIE